jgi:enoyl-CoA hydratase/carnithine racemase
MEERLTAAGGELLAEVRAGVATVTLNRPAALNSLTLGMIRGLAAWLAAWRGDERVRTVVLRGAGAKAFCAGGDIRALHDALKAGDPMARTFFEEEYALDFAIHTYPKTVVALIDGIVMGGGMGISQGAALRIVGERTRMAMPETAIGLFPDVGGSYFLSRLPGQLGPYLGLVGPTLRAADAVYCGLADLDVSPEPAPSELEALRPAIDAHFRHESLEAIVASLGTEAREPYAAWAARTVEALGKRSPTLLKVTLQQLRRAASLSLAECFRMELNLIVACMEQGDLLEGIRALLIEKDNRPRWKPATLAEVAPQAVLGFFEPRWPAARHPLSQL